MSRLFKMNFGGCNRKLLAVRLADFADDDGRGIYPSVKRLSAETELSERTVQRIIADFLREGILVVVKEATGKPGIANAYDFDLDKLFGYKPSATGDTVSPLSEVETGDNRAETGVTGDGDGCHGDTRTVIEPPLEPPSDRASAEVGGSKRSDQKKIEREFTLWYAGWKKGDVGYAKNVWYNLSDDDRADCIAKTPIVAARTNLSERVAAAVFLKSRLWTEVVEEPDASPQRGIAKPCGKLWMGIRFQRLSREPTGRLVVTSFDEREIAQGKTTREAVIRAKRLEHGWPQVTQMRDLAARKEPFVASLRLLPFVKDFHQVQRGTPLFDAWEALHERHGWPFIDRPNEYVWFPAIDESADDLDQAVEDALAQFLSTISEAGDDDAA